jgi:hypothetical protein
MSISLTLSLVFRMLRATHVIVSSAAHSAPPSTMRMFNSSFTRCRARRMLRTVAISDYVDSLQYILYQHLSLYLYPALLFFLALSLSLSLSLSLFFCGFKAEYDDVGLRSVSDNAIVPKL